MVSADCLTSDTLHDDGARRLAGPVFCHGLGGRPGMPERCAVTQWCGPGSPGSSQAAEAREAAPLRVSSQTFWKLNWEAAEPCSPDDCFY